MKIEYDVNGFEILDEYKYIPRRDVFRRRNLYYKFIPACKECGKAYFMRLTYPTKYCSRECASKSPEVRNTISKSLKGHKRSLKERVLIKQRMSKGGVVKKNLPLFDTYVKQLIPIEEVRNSNGVLEVRCTVCGKWFVPKRTRVEARAQFIKGNITRESRFYCSDECKSNCTVFNRRIDVLLKNNEYFTVSDLRIWSSEVLRRSNYKCVYCGEKAELAHHIIPKKVNPALALDPDNGIACCKECHNKYAHKGECSFVELARFKCGN